MENQKNLPNKFENHLKENQGEGLIRKYLTIIEAFENLQSRENKRGEQAFHAVILNKENSFRIFRTINEGDSKNEMVVTDSINNNAYGPNDSFVIMYTVTKNTEGMSSAVIRDTSKDVLEKLPMVIGKLEEIVRQEGTRISFMPGGEFEFDGQIWKKV